MEDSKILTSFGALLTQQLQPIRDDLSAIHTEISELKVAGVRRNGHASSTSTELTRLSGLIEALPCSQHAKEMADMRLEVALLKREDKAHDEKVGRQEKQLDKTAQTWVDVVKYVVTTVLGLVIGYFFFKITGVTP
jgi:hypothetical protein